MMELSNFQTWPCDDVQVKVDFFLKRTKKYIWQPDNKKGFYSPQAIKHEPALKGRYPFKNG
jgi:hypothetical protein